MASLKTAIQCHGMKLAAQIRFTWCVAGRRFKVISRYALDSHLDTPTGSGAFPSRIFARGMTCCKKSRCDLIVAGQFSPPHYLSLAVDGHLSNEKAVGRPNLTNTRLRRSN